MRTDAQRFVIGWVIACVVIAAGIGVANALVDPYLVFNMPRLKGFNQKKPSVERFERLMKAYEVLRAAPKSLILGTSRPALGLDADHASWPATARPVYNLGLAAADPYTSYRYLQHVLAQRDIAIVILGLDFEYFLVGKPRDLSAAMAFESYLNVGRDGSPSPGRRLQQLRVLAESTLSLEALGESVATVVSNLGGESTDVSSSGNLSEAAFRRATEEVGSTPLFAQRNLYNFKTYRGRTFPLNSDGRSNSPALADLQSIVDLCRSRRIQLELVIQPMHADMLETLDLLGVWPAFEMWKRQLVAVSSRVGVANGRPAVHLWDFSGYDRFSTESLPSDKRALRWFWEPTHYTKALGDILLARIFDGPDTSYGVVLTAATIEAHLAEIREHRQWYRESHPEAIRRVRAVYDSSSR